MARKIMQTKIFRNETKPGPVFIGVGPEKTGTTWVDEQLRNHPDIWLPPIKELRYFWESENFPNETFFARLNTKASWHRQQYNFYGKNRLKSVVCEPKSNLINDFNRFLWDIRYLLYTHTDKWYLSCFPENKYSGEISPQYFFLPKSRIQKISNLLPDSKIIISLRKPVDWVWSFARMNTKSGFLQKKYGSLDNYINDKITNCSYSNAVSNWRELYKDKQVLVLFYDELKNDPWEYYKKICHFIGITPDEELKSSVTKIVNIGENKEIPDKFIGMINNAWREDIQKLSQMVPNVPAAWLD